MDPYVKLPDCVICKSEFVKDIERKYRRKHKVLPLAIEYAPKLNMPSSTVRVKLKLHFDNLHRKYRIAEAIRNQELIADIQDKGVPLDFDSYKEKALSKAFLHLEDPGAKVTPKDVAVLENVSINRAKIGLEKKALELRMAQVYGGYFTKAIEGEVVKDVKQELLSRGVQPENKG